jgi:hypothetical protein
MKTTMVAKPVVSNIAHLCRMFPKRGVTSRSQPHEAIS